jgi:excisionase family DNA binding protein
MPDRLARKLDRAAERLGASKRDLLAALVEEHLNVDGGEFLGRPMRAEAAPDGEAAPAAPEVLTVDEAAALLRVAAEDVTALIEAGGLPARRVGAHWRLSREAVLGWLAGGGVDEPLPGQV